MRDIKIKKTERAKIKFLKTKEQVGNKIEVFSAKLSSNTQTLSRNNKILKSNPKHGWIKKIEEDRKEKKNFFSKIKTFLKEKINFIKK